MSYAEQLAKLKNRQTQGTPDPTKPTEPGFDGFVGSAPASNEDTQQVEQSESALLRTLNRVTSDTGQTVQSVYESLSPDDIDAWQRGQIDADNLRAVALALDDDADRQAGRIPTGYEYPGQCQQCGPVWLPVLDSHVESCPWCLNWHHGRPIPRPRPVTCATCQHFRRTDHPHLGQCAKGVKPPAAAGFWDTDPHACLYWLKA